MWRPGREDYVGAAAAILGLSFRQVEGLARLALAESALYAPFAGFGDEDAYPTLELKAAVLLERLVRNHPLPDGNKRTGFAVMIRFLDRNGLAWGEQAVQADATAVERVAAGNADLDEIMAWIRRRTSPT